MENIVINIDENIILKSWQIDFAPDLFSLTDKNRKHLSPWLGWVPNLKDIRGSESFILDSIKKMENKFSLELGIWYKNKLIGCLGLHNISHINKKAGIGYWLDEDYQGKGIMTRSVKSLIDYSFKFLKLNRLEIFAAVMNDNSYSIAERLSFKKEGIARQYEVVSDKYLDYYQYSLLKSDLE